MINSLVDTRDVQFVLYEVLEVENLLKLPKYADFDRDTFDATIELAEKIAVNELYPTAEEGDKIGAQWDPETKAVTLPKCFHPAMDAFYEAGFMGLTYEPEQNGMGLPFVVSAGCYEYIQAANYSLWMYHALAMGCMELIYHYGTPDQKKFYADKIMSGQWGGTMCLTEPDAGSDVGALKTRAVKQADGTYKITGQKIFISAGENDYFENIVHPVLARIEGDPKGTKGISIFIVPKYRIKPDGSKGEFNDVVCTGIEHKMGIHGQGTAQLAFGDNGDCVGYLLGEERQGMKIMFLMMNLARMGTGFEGMANASASYMQACTYAKNRIQGSDVSQSMNPDAPSVTISKHPDVKRMLLWMKSYLEAERALVYYLYNQQDYLNASDDENLKKEASALMDILCPIVKAGLTDKGVEITSMAMQVYGGYGYCKDYSAVRYMDDSKILAIFEGTNGIQSIDLVMRKILLNKDNYNYKIIRKRMNETVAKVKGVVDDKYLALFEESLQELDSIVTLFGEQLKGGKILNVFAKTKPFLDAMFMVVLAWFHIWMLSISEPKMKALVGDLKGAELEKLLNDNSEAAFYTGKVLSSQFFLGNELPLFFGMAKAIKFNETATNKAVDAIFTGMPAE